MARPTDPTGERLTGRRSEAAVNDIEILTAAFEVLTADPRASMADVAQQAHVGVASLYRRYPTRQALVHHLCLHAMGTIGALAGAGRRALTDPAVDPWTEFLGFLSAAMEAGAGSMRALSGTFTAGDDLAKAAAGMNAGIQRLVSEVQRRGAVRTDVTAADITQFFEMLRAIRIGDHERSRRLRRRYLSLFAEALRASAAGEPLPVAPPRWSEINSNWSRP